jgi:hypothetical protein
VNVLPILAIGGALYFLSKKKEGGGKLKALPPAKDLGTVFGAGGEELPDLIVATVGERFSIAVEEISGTGHSSPKSNSKYCYITATGEDGQAGGLGGRLFFIFEAKKPGEGSVVLHLTPPGAQAPPAEVIDIKVRITGA